MRPQLIIVQGFIAAGKTTFSKKLEQETGFLRLNGDEFCEAYFTPEELQEDWDTCFGKAIETLWDKAAHELSAGRSVILDFGFWTRESRDHAREQALKCNADLQHYFINTDLQTLKERIAGRGGAIAEKNLAKFDELYASFEPPATDEEKIVINKDSKE